MWWVCVCLRMCEHNMNQHACGLYLRWSVWFNWECMYIIVSVGWLALRFGAEWHLQAADVESMFMVNLLKFYVFVIIQYRLQLFYHWFQAHKLLITWNINIFINQLDAIIGFIDLTHLPRVPHLCVSELTHHGSGNGLSPARRQAIIWTNTDSLSIGPLWTNFSKIWIEILKFLSMKMHLKMSSAKWWPFCPGGDEWSSAQPCSFLSSWYITFDELGDSVWSLWPF